MNGTKQICAASRNDGYLAFQATCNELEIVYLVSGWHRTSLISVMVADILLILPAVILNSLVIAVVKKHRSLQTVSNILLACLAVSDLLIGLIMIPCVVGSLAIVLKCELVCWFYIVTFQVGYYLAIVSFLTLTLVSLDRYFAISYPFQYQVQTSSGKTVKIVVAATWLISCFVIILSYVLQKMRLPSQFFTVLAPLSIFISFTTQICTLKAVRAVRRRDASTTVRDCNVKSLRPSRRSYMREKATRVAAFILLATICCYLPHAVLTTIRTLRKDIFAFQGIYDWTKTLVIANSALNPIIYCMNIREMRSKAFRMICKYTRNARVDSKKDSMFSRATTIKMVNR